VKDFIPTVTVDAKGPRSPGEAGEFTQQPWFKHIYGHVEIWYRGRYGRRVDSHSISQWRASTLIAATPFVLYVPVTRSQVEVAGESAWLSFPDRVHPDENVLEWIQAAPDWASYSQETRSKGAADAATVAGLIRRITCRLTGTDVSDRTARNLLAGIAIHLQSASDLIMREGAEGGFARAQWELQMACESAYKGLLQQKNGSFSETHDLFTLHDVSRISEESVNRAWLRDLPRWNESANLRYGIGDHPTVVGIHHWYLVTMKIIAGVAENLRGVNLSQARLLLRRPPWNRNDEPSQRSVNAP
jgi:hypothetical protein